MDSVLSFIRVAAEVGVGVFAADTVAVTMHRVIERRARKKALGVLKKFEEKYSILMDKKTKESDLGKALAEAASDSDSR